MERVPARLYRRGGTRGVGAAQSREERMTVMVDGNLGECHEALRSTVSSSDGEVRGRVHELLSALSDRVSVTLWEESLLGPAGCHWHMRQKGDLETMWG